MLCGTVPFEISYTSSRYLSQHGCTNPRRFDKWVNSSCMYAIFSTEEQRNLFGKEKATRGTSKFTEIGIVREYLYHVYLGNKSMSLFSIKIDTG